MKGKCSLTESPTFPINFAQKLERFFSSVDRVAKFICMCLYGAMTIVIFIQICGRYVLPVPYSWTEELARYLMIWGAFIGASSLIRTGENIGVDFFIEKLPVKWKNMLYNGIEIIILLSIIYVLKIALSVLPGLGLYQTSPSLGISIFWAYFGMLIGLCLVVLQLLGMILKHALNGR
jgi:TRAP-type C4-dicarboxylate transport system permease small subunit